MSCNIRCLKYVLCLEEPECPINNLLRCRNDCEVFAEQETQPNDNFGVKTSWDKYWENKY